MARILCCLSIALAACELKHQLDPGADSGESTSPDDSDTADEASSTMDPSGTAEGGTAEGGPVPDGLYVDCGELPDGGDTIAPGPPGPLGFPELACDPRQGMTPSDNGYRCCSTDPATVDGQLPAYRDKGIDGSEPLYADMANRAGSWGMCVRTEDIPTGSGLVADPAFNCPIPCNPTWDESDVASVCGVGRVCCQTTEVTANDCVQENGIWRPVTGADIGAGGVMPPTNWNQAAHDTHQDPNGTVCAAASGGAGTALFNECIRHLSVADQRGFCMALQPGQLCPHDDPSYIDACEAMN